tara:strand:- start:84 stop:1136 length:1053 start_codon:yes stop_codon:yes gene_type:complete
MAYAAITKPSLHFNTKLYTGNGGTNAQTGVGFQPDLIWTKNRSSSQNHLLYDAIRGIGYYLYPNLTNAQGGSGSPSTTLVSFDSDGFTLGSGDDSNVNGENGVAWSWKAANSSGSSNSDGSITSTVSANTTAKFSIVKWDTNGSAHTVGHGLGTTPQVIIARPLHESNNWVVYHHKNTSSPETDYLSLDNTGATGDYPIWNDTAPTNSVFSWGAWSGNDAGGSVIAYCFAEIKGYSKFGKYIGNGNVDGTFVYTGFSPAFVMTKRTDSASDWLICDNKRPGYNVVNKKLFPNGTSAEDSYDSFDFLSSGFKIRSSGSGHNASGGTFIYMAFAAEPFVANVGSNGVPATAV